MQRNFVKYLSRKTYRSYISSLSATISSPNRPSLYQFIRTQRPSVSRAPIQCLIVPDGNRQSEAKSIANTLNKQVVSSGLPDHPNWVILPLNPAAELRAPLLDVFTTTGVVCKQFKRLKICKSPGKDGIPKGQLLHLSYPLCLLFNFSYSAEVFPSARKTAIVVPIFKKGQRSQAVNYRPISLLPAISKVCEHIFYESPYLHVTHALSSAQSGFCRGDSTTLQLTCLIQDIHGHRNLKKHVGLIFFDLSKAFETVRHSLASRPTC